MHDYLFAECWHEEDGSRTAVATESPCHGLGSDLSMDLSPYPHGRGSWGSGNPAGDSAVP